MKMLASQVPNMEYGDGAADAITRKSQQLLALLSTITSNGFEAFEANDARTKLDYLFACTDLARQISLLTDYIEDIDVTPLVRA